MSRNRNIALFASGSGSNVENIYKYFESDPDINISCVLCNNPHAYVLQRAAGLGIETRLFDRNEFQNTHNILDYLISKDINLIVLAGFLWLIPGYLIDKYENRIINIHPALLPKYGGKGMYGMAVHRAVIDNKDEETGITIHYVNNNYDEGTIIFQQSVPVMYNDTPETIAEKVHKLEYIHYPVIIKKLILNL